MKKVVALVLALVMLYALSIPAFAAPDSFTVSPGTVGAPTLISFINETADCTADIIVTAYKDRAELTDDKETAIEEAYKDIIDAADLSALEASLADAANKLGISTADLAVSDLFDVSYNSCDVHDSHGSFTIQLKANTFSTFVKLLHYTGEAWEAVEGATVDESDVLTFTVDNLSPFAVVVNTKGADIPVTGDYSYIFYGLMIIASLTGIAVIGYRAKKAR